MANIYSGLSGGGEIFWTNSVLELLTRATEVYGSKPSSAIYFYIRSNVFVDLFLLTYRPIRN